MLSAHKRTPLLLGLSAGLLIIAIAIVSMPPAIVHIAVPPSPLTIRTQSTIASSVLITVSRKTTPGIFEITRSTGGSGTLTIELPVEWELREVRNGSMKDVTHTPAEEKRRVWTLPSLRTLSFTMPQEPSSLSLINGSSFPLSVRAKQVFVQEQRIDDELFLVREQPLKLW